MSIAVITGASRGLGLRVASGLAEAGIDLLIVGRDKPRLLSASKYLSKFGVRVAPVEVDLSETGAAKHICNVADQFGPVDILINNAAIQGPIGNAWEISADDHERTLRVNFSAPVHLCNAMLPSMIARGKGCIINISGGGATSPRPGFSAYSAAKTALVRFTETLAIETSQFGIRVNAIAPGAFRSGMTDAILAATEKSGTKEVELAQRLISEDSGAAEKAAQLIRYLALGDGQNISGRLISAVWDNWESLHNQGALGELYTLRRTTPQQHVPA